MKPVATVQLPVAKFQIVVSDIIDNEELGQWVRRFARALSLADPSLEPFAAELLQDVENYREAENKRKQEAKARREQQALQQKYAEQESETIGDAVETSPRTNSNNPYQVTIPRFVPPSTTDMYDFCQENGLDSVYGRQWWDMHNERGWKMKDGSKMKDWRAALTRYVKSKQKGVENG